jgi:protocatechuate 3,4-dioxygenase beta subunit
MRRRVLGAAGVALVGLCTAVWLSLGRSPSTQAPTSESGTPSATEKRWEPLHRAPTPPPKGTLRIQGTVRDDEGPVAGARVTATRPTAGETLSELPCPELPENSSMPKPLAPKLPECMVEAESQVVDMVLARYGEAPRYAEATTGADGSFVLEGLPEGTFMLWAQSERGAKRHSGVAAGTQDVQLVLEAGLTLEGTVRDVEGRPLPDVRLTILHEKHTRFFDTKTGAQGRFRVGPLPRDSYALVAEKEGWLPTFQPHGLRELLKGEVVLFRPTPLRGQVLSDGAPTPGAQVRLASRSPSFEARAVETDEEGRFTFEALGPGDYQLTASSQGQYAFSEVELGVNPGPPEEVVLNLGDARYIEGTVGDSFQRPLEGAEVTVRPEDEYGRSWKAVTDARGHYQVGPMPPGAYAFDISARGYVDVQNHIQLIDRDTGRVDFTLQSAARVAGVLVDEEGKPIPDIRLYLMHPTELPGEFDMPPDWGWSDQEGRFSMDAPAAGGWVLTTEDERFLPQAVRVQAPVEGLRVVLSGGATVAGTVTDARGTPVERARIILWYEDKEGPTSSKVHVTDERGRFTLRGIKPGSYRVEATLRGPGADRTAVQALEVRGSETHEVALRFKEGWTLSGTVVDVEGQPLEGVAVHAVRESKATGLWLRGSRRRGVIEPNDTYTDAAGRFTVKHLVGEVYEVSAWKDGFTFNAARSTGGEGGDEAGLSVREGQGELRLVLDRLSRVRGRVVGPDGAPLRRFSLNGRPLAHTEGAFELPFEGAEELRLEFTAPGMAPVMRLVQTQEGKDMDLGEVRMGKGRRVEGRVVDAETGAPVAEVRVQVGAIAPSGAEAGFSEGLLKLTGEEGTFEFSQVEPRPLTLLVDHYEYLETRLPLGAEDEKVTVRLNPGARVEATLRGPQGRPLSGEVELLQVQGYKSKRIHVRSGKGERRGFEPGLYVAQVSLEDDPSVFIAQQVHIPTSGVVTLDFTQRDSGTTLNLRVDSAEPLGGVLVVPGGLSLPINTNSLSLWRFVAQEPEKEEGRTRSFRYLPPGRVTVLVVAAYPLHQFHLEELELPPAGVVERVIQPTWRPLALPGR